MTTWNKKTCRWGKPKPDTSMRTTLCALHRPTPKERKQYAIEWSRCPKVTWKCDNYIRRGCSRGVRDTRHGRFCRTHYINHPRCTVEGCERLSCIDDGHNQALNPDMECRDHLFHYEEERRVATPTWTHSMIGESI